MRSFSVLDLDCDWSGHSSRSQLSHAAPSRPSLRKPDRETLGQESEHVKEGRFAASVGPYQHRERGHVLKLDISKDAIVPDMYRFNAGKLAHAVFGHGPSLVRLRLERLLELLHDAFGLEARDLFGGTCLASRRRWRRLILPGSLIGCRRLTVFLRTGGGGGLP